MMNRIAGILFCLVTASLAACTQPVQPAPTILPTSLPVTDTSQPVPSPLLTPSDIPATATTLPTPEPTTDWAATQQALPAAVMTATTPQVIQTHASPDGRLRAEVIRYACVLVGEIDENAYEQLKMIWVSDGTERVVADQLQYCEGLGAYGLGGLFWSSNGRYFYFTTARDGVPDGGGCEVWVRSMSRFDTTTGSLEITPGIGQFLADNRRMVIPSQGEFVLWDLDNGVLTRTAFLAPGALLQDYQLSPNKKSLVYLLSEDCAWSPGKTYLSYWDISTSQHTLLLEAEQPALVAFAWQAGNLLTLEFSDASKRQFDLDTQQFVP